MVYVGEDQTISPCKTLHTELSKIKGKLDQVGEISAEEVSKVIEGFNGNTNRTYNRLRSILRTAENEREFEDAKEMHKEVMEKALSLF